MMFVRRQTAEHRNTTQVQEIQKQSRQGPTPMDVGAALIAAIEQLKDHGAAATASLTTGHADGHQQQEELSTIDMIIGALKGKGEGKGKGKVGGSNQETRERWNCGKSGHLSRDCRQPRKEGPKGKRGGKGINAADEAQQGSGAAEDSTITIGCLRRSDQEPSQFIGACATRPGSHWNGHILAEVTLDSGAAECVCGPDHSGASQVLTNEGAANARVEYVCADGGKIPNLGAKDVRSVTDNGGKLNVRLQVTQVDRPLLAVSKAVDAGHEVVFTNKGGFITHGATGCKTPFVKKNGVYTLNLWVPTSTKSGGTRQ